MKYVAEVEIQSYFSLPTDLASEMKDWPEFLSGEQYNVQLESSEPPELVDVAYLSKEEDGPCIRVRSTSAGGALFQRVLGTVVYALAAHSDDLMIYRWTR